MASVLDLLESVPPRSADAAAAAELRQRILDERQALAEERARRRRLVEGAGPGAGALPPGGGTAAEAAGEAAATPEPEPRAPSQLAAGTELDDFRKAHGGCFEPRSAARIGQEGGGSVAGEAWALRDDEACRAANPAEVGRVVLFSGGKLVSVRESAEGKAQTVTEKIRGVRLPDGSLGYVGPDGKPRPLPPGAQVKWAEPPPAAAPPGKAGAPAPGAPGAPAAPASPPAPAPPGGQPAAGAAR
jgi:hypothetical protein